MNFSFISGKAVLFFSLLITSVSVYAQCTQRYQQRYFNTVQKFEDVVYSKDAPTLFAASITAESIYDHDLVMDIYTPPATDTVTDRPVIILAHGGGFINVVFMGGTLLVGTMDNDDVQALADTLAHWGFVTASIEYRLGFNPSSTSSIKRAVWRGAQDVSAAVRFFRKNAALLGVDPERVFVGGSSAGAFCCIHSTFVDYTERMPESHELVPLLKRDLGAMHGRPVVELSGTNPFTGNNVAGNDVDSMPVGVAAYWGAVADTNWLSQGNNKAPMIMFHGLSDVVVYPSCNRPFASVALTAPITCGTTNMEAHMAANNMPHEAYFADGEGHEYWGALNGNWTATGPNAYWPDIIKKTADFFYKLMQPVTPVILGPDSIVTQQIYTFSVQNPILGYSYCWDINEGVIISQNPQAATIQVQFDANAVNPSVSLVAIDQADVKSQQTLKQCSISYTSISNIDNRIQRFNILPNPATTSIQLHFETSATFEATVMASNAVGQIVYKKKLELQNGSNAYLLNTEYFSKGVYTIQIQTNKGRMVRKLIIQ